MFAPLVAKSTVKSTEPQRTAVAAQWQGRVAPAHDNENRAARIAGREPTPSWNFGKVPVFASGHAEQLQRPTSPAPSGVLQRKCACGNHSIAGGGGASEIIINGPGDKQDSKSPAPPPKAPTPAPKQTPPTKGTGCPPDIKVAGLEQINDPDFGKNGVKTGWGGIALMEVSDPGGKVWDGAEIHEHVKQTKNTCGARARKVCSNESGEGDAGGSTFKVGEASNALGRLKLPAAKNSFYDLHIFQRGDVSILHELGKSSCEIQCQQSYSCGGKQVGPDFTITYTTKKDTIAKTYDVTRVEVGKQGAAKAVPPAAPPSGDAKH